MKNGDGINASWWCIFLPVCIFTREWMIERTNERQSIQYVTFTLMSIMQYEASVLLNDYTRTNRDIAKDTISLRAVMVLHLVLPIAFGMTGGITTCARNSFGFFHQWRARRLQVNRSKHRAKTVEVLFRSIWRPNYGCLEGGSKTVIYILHSIFRTFIARCELLP